MSVYNVNTWALSPQIILSTEVGASKRRGGSSLLAKRGLFFVRGIHWELASYAQFKLTQVQTLCLMRSKREGFLKALFLIILRKEVIQPQVPLRLPCYDFTPVADPTVVACLLAVSTAPSGKTNSHGVTGGVYKARERIHRGMLIHDY